jgi:hypothetical protein
MWNSSWSEPVVLDLVTEDGVGGDCGSLWVAVGIRSCQFEAIKNRADIGAELPVFGVAGGSNERSGVDRGLVHLAQLTKENPGGIARGCSSQECEYGGHSLHDYRYPLALCAFALVSSAGAAISVYRISYRIPTSLIDVARLFISGGILGLSVPALFAYISIDAVLH